MTMLSSLLLSILRHAINDIMTCVITIIFAVIHVETLCTGPGPSGISGMLPWNSSTGAQCLLSDTDVLVQLQLHI